MPPAAPGQVDLSEDDDSGVSNTDNITRVTTGLTFGGAGAEANGVVTLYSSIDGSIGGTSADGLGNWSGDVSLTENSHNVVATVTDPAGNESSPSVGLSVTIDVSPPPPTSSPDLDGSDDTGISSTDNLTKNVTGLTFQGSVSKPTQSSRLVVTSPVRSETPARMVLATGVWTSD